MMIFVGYRKLPLTRVYEVYTTFSPTAIQFLAIGVKDIIESAI